MLVQAIVAGRYAPRRIRQMQRRSWPCQASFCSLTAPPFLAPIAGSSPRISRPIFLLCRSRMIAVMTIASRIYGRGLCSAAVAGGNDSAATIEATETIRVSANTAINTASAIPIDAGESASHTPSEAATPRPPWNLRKIDAIAPAKAANPTRASSAGIGPTTSRANSTGKNPLRTSAPNVTAAGILPPARATLVVPMFPEPVARGSKPQARPTNTPTGIAPNR
jgi:hypothetical protein